MIELSCDWSTCFFRKHKALAPKFYLFPVITQGMTPKIFNFSLTLQGKKAGKISFFPCNPHHMVHFL